MVNFGSNLGLAGYVSKISIYRVISLGSGTIAAVGVGMAVGTGWQRDRAIRWEAAEVMWPTLGDDGYIDYRICDDSVKRAYKDGYAEGRITRLLRRR
jgi:hypothetical protein